MTSGFIRTQNNPGTHTRTKTKTEENAKRHIRQREMSNVRGRQASNVRSRLVDVADILESVALRHYNSSRSRLSLPLYRTSYSWESSRGTFYHARGYSGGYAREPRFRESHENSTSRMYADHV